MARARTTRARPPRAAAPATPATAATAPTPARPRHRPSFVVGIGGSAGGLDAYEQFFATMPPDTGMAFVVVTHLDPTHKTLLPELLQRTTAMPVREILDGTRLASNAVFIIPADRELIVENEVLRLRPSNGRARTPIDGFLRSLAHERGPTAIGVILSGMGADGSQGLRAIVDAGGAALVQDPANAAFDPMPRAAVAAVPEATVTTADQLPAAIVAHAAGPQAHGPAAAVAEPVAPVTPVADGAPAALERVLELLRQQTGHDMSLYKRAAIERRLERRLAVHRLASLDAYVAYLAGNPEEAALLFRELLIGVTHFFRDEEAFAVLAEVGLPAVLAAGRELGPLRAWVAGCSTGEEAYSLAIAVHEAIAVAKQPDLAIQIYATDVDPAAIAVARTGQYDADITQHVSPERLARYFTRTDRGYRICKEIRDTVVFAEHDLIADPPFTRLDLLCCRNVLIYLQPLLQQRLLPQFHYALRPGGLLVLGSSESVSAASQLFTAIDLRAKVFRSLDVARTPLARIDARLVSRPTATVSAARIASELTVVEAARRAIVETLAPPTVVINERGDILYSSRRTGRYLEPAVGKTNINIFAMARDGLGPHLSVAVRQAIAKRRRGQRAGPGHRGRSWPGGRRPRRSCRWTSRCPCAGCCWWSSTSRPPAARAGPGAHDPKAPAAIERELARTKAHLQMVVREMEASQAQVEATNDQLQSANEELQSTNEEVTTSKEELQSLNEELLTVNSELEAANHELATANDDLRNLLNSTKIPTLFLDGALRIKRFTNEATRIANLLPNDVGRALTDITLKVAYDALVADVREVLDTLVFKEVQVVGADGARYMIRIHPYRTMANVIDGVVITFSDVTALRRAEEALAARTHDDVVARLLDRWPGMVYVRDLELAADVYLNDRARAWLRAATDDGPAAFESLLHPEDRGRAARALAALPDGEVLARRSGSARRRRPSPVPRARVGARARAAVDRRPDPRPGGHRGSERGAAMSPVREVHALVHELEVHQAELELQNHELRRAYAELAVGQHELADARDLQRAIYELAPVALLTLDADGAILDVNQAAAALLASPRSALVARPLALFLVEAARPRLVTWLRALAEGAAPVAEELALDRAGLPEIPVQLVGIAVRDPARLARA